MTIAASKIRRALSSVIDWSVWQKPASTFPQGVLRPWRLLFIQTRLVSKPLYLVSVVAGRNYVVVSAPLRQPVGPHDIFASLSHDSPSLSHDSPHMSQVLARRRSLTSYGDKPRSCTAECCETIKQQKDAVICDLIGYLDNLRQNVCFKHVGNAAPKFVVG